MFLTIAAPKSWVVGFPVPFTTGARGGEGGVFNRCLSFPLDPSAFPILPRCPPNGPLATTTSTTAAAGSPLSRRRRSETMTKIRAWLCGEGAEEEGGGGYSIDGLLMTRATMLLERRMEEVGIAAGRAEVGERHIQYTIHAMEVFYTFVYSAIRPFLILTSRPLLFRHRRCNASTSRLLIGLDLGPVLL